MTERGTLLLGTHFYNAQGDAARRQDGAARAMAALPRVQPVNVQAASAPFEHEYIETLPTLTRTAREAVHASGRSMPFVADIFDALAHAACARGLRYFAFINGDIIVTQAAVDRVLAGSHDAGSFARMDVDDAGRELGLMIHGIDMFAFDLVWWETHRHRFRAYIIGAPCFDNVFTAIMMVHGRGFIENRKGEIQHVAHPRAWSAGLYERHNHYLAALDAPYFSMWARYVAGLEALRRADASGADEEVLLRDTFAHRPSPLGAIWHAGRSVRARWRYVRDRARLIATAAGAPR